MADKCDHLTRVSIHPSIKIGGASIGRCTRDALPGMLVCAEHATPDAIRMLVHGYEDRAERLRAKAMEELKYANLVPSECTATDLVKLAEYILEVLK